MSQRQLKFGALIQGVGGPGDQTSWLDPEMPGDASVDLGYVTGLAKRFEDAKLDFVFVADSQFISRDSPPHYLNRFEPLTLLSALAAVTSQLGLAATITTSYTEPFHVARQLASLDLLSRGRAAWNVVTSLDIGTAGLYGREGHLDYATRYGRAREHVDVVRGLWDSYEDDAFPRDQEAGVFFDRSRLHDLGHRGEHFSVTGPLNVERSRQGQPVIFQAGDSEEGRDLAASVGEGIFTMMRGFEAGQAFYAEMKQRAADKGRDPDSVLILPALTVVLADTDEEAQAIENATFAAKDFAKSLAEFGRPYGWHDFSQYDPDAPFPDVAHLAATGSRTIADHVQQVAADGGLTLRQVVQYLERQYRSAFIGTAQTVADQIQTWFEGRAVDGFILAITIPREFDRFAAEVLPILRERGLFRTDYEAETLRGNLGLPVPENRYTAARRAGATDERLADQGSIEEPLVAPEGAVA